VLFYPSCPLLILPELSGCLPAAGFPAAAPRAYSDAGIISVIITENSFHCIYKPNRHFFYHNGPCSGCARGGREVQGSMAQGLFPHWGRYFFCTVLLIVLLALAVPAGTSAAGGSAGRTRRCSGNMTDFFP